MAFVYNSVLFELKADVWDWILKRVSISFEMCMPRWNLRHPGVPEISVQS